MLKTKLSIALTLVLAPGLVHATNGYFLPGFGVKSQGAGGVGIALQADSLSQAANPANLIGTGMRGDLGMTLFNPERLSATGAATGLPADPDGLAGGFNFGTAGQLATGASQSGNRLYLMPDMAFSMPLSEKVSVGLAVVGNGGMNTTYKENIFGLGGGASGEISTGTAKWGGRRDALGIDLMQLLAPVSVAYQVVPDHTLGVSLNLAAQRFKAKGLGQFVSFGITSDNKHMTNNGYDYSYGGGVRLGWLGKFADDRVSVGATWASKTYMTEFDKYKGLFAEQGDFDIPENYGLGIAIKATDRLTAAFDVTRIIYSGVKAVSNPGPGIDGGSGVAQDFILNEIAAAGGNNSTHPMALGQDDGMGFGWQDMTVYKLGVIYDATDRLTLRAGYNYGRMPVRIDQAVFSALAPGVTEHHYSAGFTYQMKGELDWEISGAYMYVANKEVRSNQQAVVDQVWYKMHQHVLGIGLGIKY
ncbi:MAG: outer membrane protein transport protein [Thiobacillus sp.]|uniref:OmpP1/FadL family transporter n=1 Tax=Thiobacillus sp. TaxID=924 RepID=UPI002733E6A6|nr:outer membrane protein transport protein [Thiobacillus sp.]MDP3584458.1 outer membrane protein transport protein [Thiobacillus sp.]